MHNTPSSTSMRQPHWPCQTTACSVHALPHNYATVPAGFNGTPKFTSKTAPSLRRSPPNQIHPSLDWPHSSPQMASRSNQPFFHWSPTGQIDTQTNRWCRGMASKNTVYARYTDRKWHANNNMMNQQWKQTRSLPLGLYSIRIVVDMALHTRPASVMAFGAHHSGTCRTSHFQ